MKNQDKLELRWSGGAQKAGTAREGCMENWMVHFSTAILTTFVLWSAFSSGMSLNKARETQSVVHCVFDSFLNGTIGHGWTLFNSVFPLTDKILGFFSGTPLIRMDSFPFFEDFALIYVPKIGVEFAFTLFLMKLLMCCIWGISPFSRISVATFFYFSIMPSGKDLIIFRRLSFAFTSAK